MSNPSDLPWELQPDPDDPEDEGLEAGGPSAIELEITDTLDLHFFPPREIGDLVRNYLDLAWEKGLRELRIVHGKGIGVQRRRVRAILAKDPRVIAYGDPPDSSSWGATRVELGDPTARSTAEPTVGPTQTGGS